MKTNHCIPMKNQKMITCSAIVIVFLVLNLSLSGSSFQICGNISTYEGEPVQHVRILFTAIDDTSAKYFAITDKQGNYSLLVTHVTSKDEINRSYQLVQNYPNPFNDATTIRYQLRTGGNVTITIYDILGREVKTVVTEKRLPGICDALWDGTNKAGQKVSSGIYFYRVSTPEVTVTRKMVYLPGIHISSSSPGWGLSLSHLNKNSTVTNIFKRFNIYIDPTDSTQPNIWSFMQDSVDVAQNTVMNFQLFELTSTWQPLGLTGKHVSKLVLAGDSLYACAGKAGLFRLNVASTDTVWEYLGFSDTARNPNYWGADAVFIDPLTKWIFVGLEIHEWSGIGLYRSEDLGRTWIPSDSGISQYASMISPSVYSLSGSSQLQHVLLAGMSSAIFKSEDGGLSWKHVWGLLHAGNWVYTIEFNLTHPNEIWAGGGTARGESFALKSNNSAEKWERIIIPREPFTASLNDIAIDPVTDGTVYFGMGNMILKSIDAGQTWRIVLNNGWWLSINPRNTQELFVVGPKLFRTIDGGQSWHTMLPPSGRRSVGTLAVDWDKKLIYAGTANPEYGIYKLLY